MDKNFDQSLLWMGKVFLGETLSNFLARVVSRRWGSLLTKELAGGAHKDKKTKIQKYKKSKWQKDKKEEEKDKKDKKSKKPKSC